MPKTTYSGPLGEVRAASTAAGGTAVTNTVGFQQLPNGTRYVFLTPRNFAGTPTAVVVQLLFNPYLIVLRTQDNLATATDYSSNAQDADTATKVTLNGQDTAANGDYLYVGSHLPFRGVNVDVNNTNGNASVLAVDYWNGSAWADVSATDGTASGGATFAQDGNVTWTVPAAWAKGRLRTIASASADAPACYDELYWTRFKVSAALDSTTDLNSLLAMNRSTAYAEFLASYTVEQEFPKGPGGYGCVEHKTDASGATANLVVNVATASMASRFA